MPSTKYLYSVASDLSGINPKIKYLQRAVDADVGIPTCDHIRRYGDDVDVWFADALSGAEKTALDNVIAGYNNPPKKLKHDTKKGNSNVSRRSETFADIPDMSVTVETHSTVMVIMSASLRNGDCKNHTVKGGTLRIVNSDASVVYATTRCALPPKTEIPITFSTVVHDLTSGNNTFKVQWKTDKKHTMYMDANNNESRHISVINLD